MEAQKQPRVSRSVGTENPSYTTVDIVIALAIGAFLGALLMRWVQS